MHRLVIYLTKKNYLILKRGHIIGCREAVLPSDMDITCEHPCACALCTVRILRLISKGIIIRQVEVTPVKSRRAMLEIRACHLRYSGVHGAV